MQFLLSAIGGFYDPLIWMPSVAAALLIRADWRASLLVAVVLAAAYGLASGMTVQSYLDPAKPRVVSRKTSRAFLVGL